ncbi:MAG: chromate resistance protein [Thaumarchaeota archaeon]|nr:chromate resistance protein [Nitrososphaerota archaeon]
MKWVTREHAKVDRIACPWLIKKFVDKDAELLFVPAEKVIQIAKEQNAAPFDVPNVELGHHGEECSFDAIVKKYGLDKKDPALVELAKIVRGADTPNRTLTPQSEGLLAIAYGFSMNVKDDFDNMEKQFHVYDALYSFCEWKLNHPDYKGG